MNHLGMDRKQLKSKHIQHPRTDRGLKKNTSSLSIGTNLSYLSMMDTAPQIGNVIRH